MARMTIDYVSELPIYKVHVIGNCFTTLFEDKDGYERQVTVSYPDDNLYNEVYLKLIDKLKEKLSFYDLSNCFFSLPNGDGIAVIEGKIKYWKQKYWD